MQINQNYLKKKLNQKHHLIVALNAYYQDDMYSVDEPVARISRTLSRRSRQQPGTSAAVHVRIVCCCFFSLILKRVNEV